MGFLSDPGVNGKPLEGVRKVINDCILGKGSKKKKGGLEIRLSEEEHWLPLQRPEVPFVKFTR